MPAQLVLAGQSDLAAAWSEIGLPMAAYVAACGWRPPGDPAAAARWMVEGDRHVLLRAEPGPPLIVSIGRAFISDIAQLVVVSALGAEFDGIGAHLEAALAAAFGTFGFRKCEWRVLRSWTRAREAGARLGFQEEGMLPEACRSGLGYEDLVLLGVLSEDWPGA